MSKQQEIDKIIGDLLEHRITRFEAVGRIEDMYRPATEVFNGKKTYKLESLHWLEGQKDGKGIDILHIAGCSGECEAYRYLMEAEELDIKPGKMYEMYKLESGKWKILPSDPKTSKQKK